MTTCASPLLLAVGTQGLAVSVPQNVDLLPVEQPVVPGAALTATQQRELVRAALAQPRAGQPLRTLAHNHRRAVIVAGGLAQPAPYENVLPPVIQALVDAGIRPTRIALLVGPEGGPVLGRGAIHRYGEEVVGEHELASWAGTEGGPDPRYTAADLRLQVVLAGYPPPYITAALEPAPDLVLALQIGRKAQIDISGVETWERGQRERSEGRTTNERPEGRTTNEDVLVTTGGGSDWEETLEEALLGLASASSGTPPGATAVLAFSGSDGLGSAPFVRDLWALCGQAEELLANGDLPQAPAEGDVFFDPAATLAVSLARFQHLVLFSPGLAQHSEGDELRERLAEWPRVAGRLQVCATEDELWPLLERLRGGTFRLRAVPLGWRGKGDTVRG